MANPLLIVLGILSLTQLISAARVVCYHGTWSHYRPGNGQFNVSNTPAELCTHYIYAFVGINGTTSEVRLLDSFIDIDLGGFADAVALKNRNPDLKVILAIGGYNEGSRNYSIMAADPSRRAAFVSSALALLQEHGFDGFDLDWEYPGRNNGSSEDRDNYSQLIRELHEAFSPLGLSLSAAVAAAGSTIDVSYDVPVLSRYLDFINVMAYDFHGSWDNFAGHSAPLNTSSRFYGTIYQGFNVIDSLNAWLVRGADPSKLNLGVPFYGRTHVLADPSNHVPGSPTLGQGGPPGPYTQESGAWGYNEIVELIAAGNLTLAFDYEQQAAYAYANTTWLSYENVETLIRKAEYATSLNLGGISIWSIETDDFHAVSGTQFPLLNAINSALRESPSDPDVPPSDPDVPPSSPDVPPSTDPQEIPSANSCASEGYFRSSIDCRVFYYCRAYRGAYLGYTFTCPPTTVYDTTLGVCNYPENVQC